MPTPIVRSAASLHLETAAAAEALVADLGESPSLVLFFASSDHDLPGLAAAIDARWPDAITAGCSTMGEIGPLGCTQEGVSAISIGAPVRGAAALVEDLGSLRFEDGVEVVKHLARRLGKSPRELAADKHVFLTLTDGLSGMEEVLLAAVGTTAPGVPLVGGSAGDGFRFQRTRVALNGVGRDGAAVLLLLEPGVPFHAFHAHHFQPTERRVVVTSAAPERRLVHELDGRPAIEVTADLLGVDEAALRADAAAVFGRNPLTLAFAVGGERYMRSAMTIQGESLLMGGAVEEGAVLRVMAGGDLVAGTARGMAEAVEALQSDPSAVVLFNCGGRMYEATQKDLLEPLADVMCAHAPTAGFTTYGEQFGPLQVNHTLTGLLIGRADA